MDNFDSVVTDTRIRKSDLHNFVSRPTNNVEKYLNKYIAIHTSGSSGNVGIFVHDEPSWIIGLVCNSTRVCKANYFPIKRDRTVFCGVLGGYFTGITMASFVPKIFTTMERLSLQDPISENVGALNQIQPTVLLCYASTLEKLAREAIAGRLNIKPRVIGAYAESLTEQMRSIIDKVWRGKYVDTYSTTESTCIAARYSGDKLYSVFDDINIMELLDEYNEPVSIGETGNIVITNLHNRIMPLIRYEIEDRAERGPEQKDNPFSTFTELKGRINDELPIFRNDGTRSTLSPIILNCFSVPGLHKAKFILTSPDHIDLLYVSERNGDIDGRVYWEFSKILKASNAANIMRFHVRRVDELPPDKNTGKFKITEILY
jgi:phenylacetate-coenzyme A ligase PaaK-like adenylate-forming protein